jgi:hypothetical protein
VKRSPRMPMAALRLAFLGLALQVACEQVPPAVARACDEVDDSSDHVFSWLGTGAPMPDAAVPSSGEADGALRSVADVVRVLNEDADALARGDRDAQVALERAYADVERECLAAGHVVKILPQQ